VTGSAARGRAAAVAVAVATVLAAAPALGPAGCGGTMQTGTGPAMPAPATDPEPAPPADPRTPIQRRRDAACDQLGPRITACAVEDARTSLAAGKIDQRQFELDTAPGVQRKHTEEFEQTCKGAAYSSRQVRVLEVCAREETRCAPLLDCLGHLSDRPARGK
jgi:hypothetical protein